MGRPATPTARKILEGNPGKRPLNGSEPKPIGEAECPDWIGEESRDCWEYIVDMLSSVPGLLTRADSASLAIMADTLAMYRRAHREAMAGPLTQISAKGGLTTDPLVSIRCRTAAELKQWFAKFGLTPSDRASLTLPGNEEGDDELGDMLA